MVARAETARTRRSEYLRIAELVLARERRSMSARELIDAALRDQLFSDRAYGETPWQTMKARLSEEIRQHGDGSPFVRTAPGLFSLRDLVNDPQRIYRAKPFSPPRSEEQVLTIRTKLINPTERFQGIKKSWRKTAAALLASTRTEYLLREYAETIETNKQVVTYALVTDGTRLLAFRRGKYNRVENFLRGSMCIGFGGHVQDSDRDLFGYKDMGITNNVIRELAEELALPDADLKRIEARKGLECIGILNDDSSATGRRHIAFIYRYTVHDSGDWVSPKRGERSVNQLQWIDPLSAGFAISEFEYWSQLCLRAYYAPGVRLQPAFRVINGHRFASNKVLCVLGQIGSGKSEATRILREEYGYAEINSGRVLAAILQVPPVPETPREVFQKLAWDFINTKQGPSQLGRALAEASHDKPLCLIDGIRQPTTLDALKNALSQRGIAIIFVHTPPDLAFEFYKARVQTDITIDQFLQIREAAVEADVASLIAEADAVLYNWTGRQEYAAVVRRLMREVQVPRAVGK